MTWVNFFYPEDAIGYPLRPLNAAYAEAVSEDDCLAPSWAGSRGWQRLWRFVIAHLPLLKSIESHQWYFSDRRVSRRIGELLVASWMHS